MYIIAYFKNNLYRKKKKFENDKQLNAWLEEQTNPETGFWKSPAEGGEISQLEEIYHIREIPDLIGTTIHLHNPSQKETLSFILKSVTRSQTPEVQDSLPFTLAGVPASEPDSLTEPMEFGRCSGTSLSVILNPNLLDKPWVKVTAPIQDIQGKFLLAYTKDKGRYAQLRQHTDELKRKIMKAIMPFKASIAIHGEKTTEEETVFVLCAAPDYKTNILIHEKNIEEDIARAREQLEHIQNSDRK